MLIVNIVDMDFVNIKRLFVLIILYVLPQLVWGSYQPEFSTAGFFQLPNTGREVFSMNPAWRFYKGKLDDAYKMNYNDSSWTVVSLPNGIEYLPTEASGCINYQGEVWYRKHFTPDEKLQKKKIFLHFEGIMGKSKIFLNGKLLKEHFGGYLPIVIDVTDELKWKEDNVLAVSADNSNDPTFPPGKPQEDLDFTYFGGIYRDCWLIAHNNIFITDPNFENVVAGGGLFVSYENVSKEKADINILTHVRNSAKYNFYGSLVLELYYDNNLIISSKEKISLKKDKSYHFKNKILLKNPLLWSPENPNLYQLHILIKDKDNNIVDGYRRRIGVRSIEFKGKDGFWLNGYPYNEPLVGANRHQDFAILGHALPNSLHWRDAKKLRDVGLKMIRNAHCPQDPAFMDACDELGLFVIVNTPGWQFWNNEKIFENRVYDDIRQLVRRERNHPSIWLWEPILNETWYPDEFAYNAINIIKEEYPYPYCYSACDKGNNGDKYFKVQFRWPEKSYDKNDNITYFNREWGDYPDNFVAHNSPSRVARNWGEQPMLVQAKHYIQPDYWYPTYDALFRVPRQNVGGALWHAFDHQRGYHPDPFYGGIMDMFRQPKYSYYAFMSQRSPVKEDKIFETGPMVYIAHEMTPFSSKDVTVYSNCDEVRLTYLENGEKRIYNKPVIKSGVRYPIIVFKDLYDFSKDKALSWKGDEISEDKVFLLAEGIIDGKVVATHKVRPSRRPVKLIMWLDNNGTELIADGSDIVTVVAAVADRNGVIKRLNNYCIKFEVTGEGHIIGNSDIMANPVPVKWGTAPILIQSTLKPGKIRVKASVLFEGYQMPVSCELELESKLSDMKQIYNRNEASKLNSHISYIKANSSIFIDKNNSKDKERKLKDIANQQNAFAGMN